MTNGRDGPDALANCCLFDRVIFSQRDTTGS